MCQSRVCRSSNSGLLKRNLQLAQISCGAAAADCAAGASATCAHALHSDISLPLTEIFDAASTSAHFSHLRMPPGCMNARAQVQQQTARRVSSARPRFPNRNKIHTSGRLLIVRMSTLTQASDSFAVSANMVHVRSLVTIWKQLGRPGAAVSEADADRSSSTEPAGALLSSCVT